MTTHSPGRTLLSLAVSAALTAGAPAHAQTINYNGSEAEYNLLSGDTLMGGQKALIPASYINNEVNITDTDNLSATNTYKATVNAYGAYSYQSEGTNLTGNTVTVSSGTVNRVSGAYKHSTSGDVSNNVVNLTGGDVTTNVFGGYTGGSASGTSHVDNNTVTVSGGNIGGNIYGGYLYMGAGSANNNTVTISGGTVTGNVFGVGDSAAGAAGNTVTVTGGAVGGSVYGVYKLLNSGDVTANTVTVSGGAITQDVYGGHGNVSTGAVTDNIVTLTGGTVGGSVYGGYKQQSGSVVSGNSVSISGDASVTGSVYGGWRSTSSGDVATNTVSIAGGTVTGTVYGGHSNSTYTSSVTGNSVSVSGGTVGGDVVGGARSGSGSAISGNSVKISGDASVSGSVYGGWRGTASGDVTTNTVSVSGGTVGGSVYGGYSNSSASYYSAATGNAVTVSGGTLGGDVVGGRSEGRNATDNTVNLSGGTVTGGVYGGQTSTSGMDSFTGNTLNAANAKDETISVGSIQNFENVNMDLSNLSATTTALSASGDVTFGSAALDKKTTINITGVGSTGEQGRVFIASGGTMSGAFESTVSGMKTVDYLTYIASVADNNLVLDYRLNWVDSNADKAHGTFTLTDADSNFNVGASLTDNEGITDTNAAGWDGKSLTKAGLGTLTLTGENTYTGGTTISAGTLSLASVTGAGTGAIVNNARLALTGAQGTFSNAVSGSGDLAVEGGSNVIAATAASANEVDVDATSRLALASGVIWQTAGGFTNAGTLTLGSLSQLAGNVVNDGTLTLSTGKLVTAYIGGSLTNRGDVVLNPTPTSAGNRLEVSGDYVGEAGSSLSLGAVLAGDDSLTDKLSILGNASGLSTVYIANEGGSGAQTLEGIRVISVQGTSDAEFTQGNREVAGLYDYSLTRKGSNWYLTSYAEPDPVTPTDPVRQVRPEAAGYAANLQAANTLFALSLHDRVGETAYRDALTGEVRTTSLWVRNEGGRTATAMADGQNKNHTNRYVLQLGGDVMKLSTDRYGDFSLGVMGGYANAKGQTYNTLKGYGSRNTVSGYGTGLYGTWRQNGEAKGGLYADGWLQYNWFSNSVKGQDLAVERYDSQGLTASLETGYDWQAAAWNTASGLRNTLWLRPHAQAAWMGVRADDHTERNGTRVQGTGNDNVQTTLGVRAYLNGKGAVDRNTGREFQPYVEANWVHNAAQYGVRMNEAGDSMKGTRNAGELKAGVEAKFSSRLSVWGGVSGLRGDAGYSDVGASLGGRFSF